MDRSFVFVHICRFGYQRDDHCIRDEGVPIARLFDADQATATARLSLSSLARA